MAGREVPEDFAEFVTTYGRRLSAACRDIAGNDRVAEAVRVDLLAAVALGWRRRPARWRVRHALTQLDHLLRQEVRTYRLLPTGSVQIRMNVADDARTRGPDETASEDITRLADAAWQRATVLRRRARLGVAAAALVLIGFALLAPDAAPPPDGPSPEPTATPPGVTVLPSFTGLRNLPPARWPLPEVINLDAGALADMPLLASAPLPKALAVAEPSRGRVIVIGEGGTARKLDHPYLSARMVTTSLAPAGDLIALPDGEDLLLIEVTTGRIRGVSVGAEQPDPPVVIWRGSDRVLVPGPDGALEVDVTTGRVTAVVGVTGTDVVAVEGNPESPFMEMVSGTSVGSQRSRIRFWRSDPTSDPAPSPSTSGESSSPQPVRSADYDERPVSGPVWIGAWHGPAWSSALLFARACATTSLRLPADAGTPRTAIGAVQPNGRYAGTLVAVDSTQLEIQGFLHAHQLLVVARSQGLTALLAWNPIDEMPAYVATFTDEIRLSVADLLLPS